MAVPANHLPGKTLYWFHACYHGFYLNQFSDSNPMKLLVLDLDETLIYATEEPLPRPEDFTVGQYFVYKRPDVDEFLQYCRAHFLMAVWTSSTRLYAQEVVAKLFPADYPLQFVFARDRCVRRFNFELQDEYHVKDLKKVKAKGFDLEQMLMLDDSPEKLQRQYGNLVRIREWLGDTSDRELALVQQYLLTLKDCPNVRRVEKRFWRSTLLQQQADLSGSSCLE